MALICKVSRTALIVALMATASCSQVESPGEELAALPADAAGALTVGVLGLETLDAQDRATLYAFGSDGNLLGKASGRAIYSNSALSGNRAVFTTTSESVVTLTGSSRREVPIDGEKIVQSATIDNEVGNATFWYNTGVVNEDYINRFVSVTSNGDLIGSGTVDGILATATYCNGNHYAIVRDSFYGSNGNPTGNRLYELREDGELEIRGEWDSPVAFEAASTSSVCTPDGKQLLSLYRTEPDGQTRSRLFLVNTSTSNASRTESEIDLMGNDGSVRSVSILNNRVYWVNSAGVVLSVPTSGPTTVTKEFEIPGWSDDSVVSLDDDLLVVVNFEGVPQLSEYELDAFETPRRQVQLPWLDGIVGSPTESNRSVYVVSGVVSIN